MNENENSVSAADIIQKAHLAQQIQSVEAVKKLASNAKRLMSLAPFDGVEAAEVAEVLSWFDATIKGADKQLVLLNMAAQSPAPTPAAPAIKPEVVPDGK